MKAIMRDAAELKDSGIKWIGNIPSSWHIMKISRLFELIGSGTTPKSTREEYYNGTINWLQSGDINGGYVNFTDKKISKDICENNTALTIYAPPFIAIAMYGASIGNISIVDIEACTNQACCVLSCPNEIMNLNYLFYQLKSAKDEMLLSSRGGTQPNISQAIIRQMRVAVPSYKEQQYIANYLDDRCSKIDAIIAEAKASIEEYKELKQAVITQAVTLGIKKNRPLKDTHILWIGKTPCDWQVAELKFFASIKSGITLGQKYPAGAKLVEIPYLRVANVQGEYVDLSDVKTIQVLPEEVDKYRLEAGVVLMTEGGDRDKLGRGCVWHGEIAPCLHQNHVFAVTTKSDKLLPEYFSHVTTSEVARCYFDYTAKKTTNLANTNSSTIMNFRLPIPPLEEQREIVQYLDKRIKTLNDMISEKQSLIEDLEAYKKSLIYEVVTGKRKVVA